MVPGGREVNEEPMERGVSRRRTRTCGHSSSTVPHERRQLLQTTANNTFADLSHNWTLMETIIRSAGKLNE